MIKIEFSGLTFHPSEEFTNVTNLLNRIIPINDNVTNVSVEWNGKTSIVQSIFYDAFSLSFICKETEKQDFMKIAYAPKIEVIDTEISKIIQAKFIDVTFAKINDNQEFYICKFNFADYATKNIQNNLENYGDNYSLQIITYDINNSPHTSFATSCLKPIYGTDFTQNIKNDFKNRIIDYNKTLSFHNVLTVMNKNSYFDFMQKIPPVSPFLHHNKIKVVLGDIKIVMVGSFEMNVNIIGCDLYKIELKLISDSVRITSPYNN